MPYVGWCFKGHANAEQFACQFSMLPFNKLIRFGRITAIRREDYVAAKRLRNSSRNHSTQRTLRVRWMPLIRKRRVVLYKFCVTCLESELALQNPVRKALMPEAADVTGWILV
jgi:hypothetical protein